MYMTDAGDRQGHVRVHDLRTFACMCTHAAHDADVTTLEYSDVTRGQLKTLNSIHVS
jgi:hypothetical protein